jgi:hypothetical protein
MVKSGLGVGLGPGQGWVTMVASRLRPSRRRASVLFASRSHDSKAIPSDETTMKPMMRLSKERSEPAAIR